MTRHTIAALTLSLLPLGGCAAAAVAAGAGAGAFAIFKGDIDVQIDTDVATVWEGVREAVGELGLEVLKDQRDGLRGELDAKRSDGTFIRIRATGTGTVTTVVSIRVGLGNQAESRAIWRRIEISLPHGTPKSREL